MPLTFLREYELSAKFKMLKGACKTIRVAAPFWGEGAIGKLGLAAGDSMRILCNLQSGGCNPYEIERLLQLGATVKSHRRLHAKIYDLNNTVIIGSSNVSSNGLIEENRPDQGLIEANVLTDDPAIVRRAKLLLNTVWKQPQAVTVKLGSSFLEQAKVAWDNRPKSSFSTGARTLLAACREDPARFNKVYLAVYAEDISPQATQKLKKLKTHKISTTHLDVADFRDAWGYQFRLPAGGSIIDFSFMGSRPRVFGTANVQDPPLIIPVPREDDLHIAFKGSVRVLGDPKTYRLSATEKTYLETEHETIYEMAADSGLVRLTDVLDRLGKHRHLSPSPSSVRRPRSHK